MEWYLRVPAHGTITVGYVAQRGSGGAQRRDHRAADELGQWIGRDREETQHPGQETPAPPGHAHADLYVLTAGAHSDCVGEWWIRGGSPAPTQTFSCDPTVVTCNTGGGGGGGF